MRIVVTGSASSLAGALLPLLAADSRVSQLIGIDRGETPFRHERFTQILLDTRSPQLARVLAGADALIHFASTELDGAPDERRAINLAGGQNVMRCAAQQGVPRIVHLSSAAVYALPARRHPIDEAHPRGGLPGFGLSEDQSALETWLDAFEQEHPGLRLVRLRPHLVVGAHAPALVRRLLRAPVTPRFAGTAPRLQCVHALDLARAVLLGLEREVRGAFNLACADSATLRELQRAAGGGALPLPLPLVYRWVRRRGCTHAAWAEILRHEIVLDTNRARRELGWKPQYDSVRRCLEASD
ncbi:MAG TPA: NAD-dependent epimerase/dehydratase family protein [Burkholderiales bacterium]